MPQTNPLLRLHERWRTLEIEHPEAIDNVSLKFFHADLGQSGSVRVSAWLDQANAIQEITELTGALPSFDSSHRALAIWLRDQRRTEDRLSDYQKDRLEIIPGFNWSPREAEWERKKEDWMRFTAQFNRSPRIRSIDQDERSLALWVRAQRTAYRAGNISAARVSALRLCEGWRW